jgi:hypothetical protein
VSKCKAEPPLTPEQVAGLLVRDLYRLASRVRVEQGPGSRAFPTVQPADLWRTMPRIMRRLADLIDAGVIEAEPAGFDRFQMRAMADLIEGK